MSTYNSGCKKPNDVRTVFQKTTVPALPPADGCLNGDEMCDGPDGDSLPCFPCFMGWSQ